MGQGLDKWQCLILSLPPPQTCRQREVMETRALKSEAEDNFGWTYQALPAANRRTAKQACLGRGNQLTKQDRSNPGLIRAGSEHRDPKWIFLPSPQPTDRSLGKEGGRKRTTEMPAMVRSPSYRDLNDRAQLCTYGAFEQDGSNACRHFS